MIDNSDSENEDDHDNDDVDDNDNKRPSQATHDLPCLEKLKSDGADNRSIQLI